MFASKIKFTLLQTNCFFVTQSLFNKKIKQKFMTKKSLHFLKAFGLLLLTVAFGANVLAQGVSLSESFDGTTFPPTGWAIKTTIAGPGQLWTRNTGQGAIAQPHSGAADAAFRKTGGANPLLTQNLITPAFDLSGIGANTASMSFWMFNDTNFVASLDSIIVWINTSDTLLGATRIGAVGRYSAAGNAWNQHTFNYPSTFNGTTNYIIFQGVADAANTRRIYMDDVNWTAYPPACSGTPNSGTIINSISKFCGGATGSSNLSLSNTITTSSQISYNWQSSTNGISGWTTFGSNAPTATTGVLTSTMYYQCIVTCNATSQSYSTPVDSVVVSTQAKPTVTVTPSSTTFCTGGTPVSLAASGTATSFSWTSSANGNLGATTGATVTASPTAGGGFGGNTATYTVIGTLTGCNDTVTTTLSIGAKPVLNPTVYPLTGNTALPSDTVCAGLPIRLNSIPGGGANPWTYVWSDGKTTRIDTVLNPTINHTYTVIATSACGMDTGIINLIVNPKPHAAFTTTGGLAVTFTNTSVGAVSYSWNFGDGNSSTNSNPTNNYAAAGNYTVTLIAIGTTCGNDTLVQQITVTPTGINSVSLNKFNLVSYPNPANDATTVYFTAETNTAQLVLMNTLGQTIFSKTITAKNNNNFSEKIATNNLPAGIYMIQVIANNTSSAIKLVKE